MRIVPKAFNHVAALLRWDATVGVGLNLQHAATVINMDQPWNPAVLEQRIARVHRMGQQKNVQVVNFIAQGFCLIVPTSGSDYAFASRLLQGTAMAKFDRITSIRTILNGQPTIRGMRLSVRRVIEALAVYPNWDDLRREYPELEPEDIRRALEFAAQNLETSVQPYEAA